MKFGLHYQLPCYGAQSPVQRYRDTLEQSAYSEALGFESVWPVEQHFNADLSISPAPLLLLAALAERTRTLRLGIAIVLLPLSHPLRVAEEIATLDVISGGRVEFGVGRGSIPSHFAGFGVPQTESRERFVEALELIVKAWANERVSHRGRFFHVEDLAVVPKPVQRPHPPIRAAANSLETFELMGRMGLPIFVATPINPFPRLGELLSIYREARGAAGHPDNGGDDVTLALPLFVSENRAEIRPLLEPSIGHYLRTVAGIYLSSKAAAANLPERVERFGRTTYDDACASMAIFDTPEACAERLLRLRDELNVGRIIGWFNIGGMVPHARVMRGMELFAAKVMPHLQ
ncbi:MAG TPA: LLM class flavin-dependent oxidoreductase [Candidatus Binataceae bacterium]|nr:LLM class flavin-dependent oxidoreductase [Candidatus Binataceae bacterium]